MRMRAIRSGNRIKSIAATACLGLLTAFGVRAEMLSIEQRYQRAETARRGGESARAHRLLEKLVAEDPGSEEINFSYGMTCLELGDYSRAEMAFERVLGINPGNHRARLEMARALAATRRYAEARRALEQVIDADPPARVRANVEAYLAQIRAQEGRRRSYNLRLEMGAFHDSNVNAGPDSEIVRIRPRDFGFIVVDRLVVGEESKPRADYGTFLAGRGGIALETGDTGAWLAEAGALGYAAVMQEEHEYRLSYGQLHVAARRRAGRGHLFFPLRYTHVYRGGASLMQSLGTAISYDRALPPGNSRRLTLLGDLQWRDYTGRTDRDGLHAYAGLALNQVIGPKRHSAGFSLTGYRDLTDAGVHEKSGVRLGINGNLNLPRHCALYARAHYAFEEYRKSGPLDPENRRADNQVQAAAGVRKTLSRHLNVEINHQYIRNDSTFDLYGNTRNVTTVSTTYFF